MAASKQTNLATELAITLSTPSLAVLSPQARSLVITSIPELEVPEIDDLVPAARGVQVRVVIVRAPVVGVIDCWSQTWETTSQKSPRSPRQNHLRPLSFCPINSNGGSLLKKRRRGCTRVLWLGLSRCKVSSRYLPPSRAHHCTRCVEFCNLRWRR